MTSASDFAKLRPGMPVTAVQDLLAPGAQPGVDGWIRTSWAGARIDTGGHIAVIAFRDNFPSNIPIDGLHIGMTLDELSKDARGFRVAPRHYPFQLTPYVATRSADEMITAMVGPLGYVRQLEFTWANASLPAVHEAPGPIYQPRPSPDTDAAELLADWAGSATFRDSYPVRRAEAHWLRHDSTPEDRHRYVMRHNWDEGLEPLLWIIRQTDCEAATALLTFYMSRPGEFLDYAFDVHQVPGYAKAAHDLILEIRDRFVSGAYSRATIAFDAGLALKEEAYLPPAPDQAAFDKLIPPALRRDIPGRAIPFMDPLANPPRPELFRRPQSTLRPPPLTGAEQREIARVQAEVAARRRRPG